MGATSAARNMGCMRGARGEAVAVSCPAPVAAEETDPFEAMPGRGWFRRRRRVAALVQPSAQPLP